MKYITFHEITNKHAVIIVTDIEKPTYTNNKSDSTIQC